MPHPTLLKSFFPSSVKYRCHLGPICCLAPKTQIEARGSEAYRAKTISLADAYRLAQHEKYVALNRNQASQLHKFIAQGRDQLFRREAKLSEMVMLCLDARVKIKYEMRRLHDHAKTKNV